MPSDHRYIKRYYPAVNPPLEDGFYGNDSKASIRDVLNQPKNNMQSGGDDNDFSHRLQRITTTLQLPEKSPKSSQATQLRRKSQSITK